LDARAGPPDAACRTGGLVADALTRLRRHPRGESIVCMLRKAFRMSIHPGTEAEYAARHQPIWAELEATLIRHGVTTYSIFLDPATLDLFGYAEIESEARWTAIASTDVCQRWWRHMRDLMPVNPDDSPVSVDLREVFHIERPVDPEG
jgi:L-rhamnose mutarotase